MEPLIQYINKNKSIQDAIVSSENPELIESTYRLFLHYGLSMEYFLKSGFRYELGVQGVEAIFRENRKMNHVIKDFFEQAGGKFDYIINKVLQYATELKYKKDKFTLKSQTKALLNCMNCLNEVLIHNMSDSLIDFCSDVCLCINTMDQTTDRLGESIICSFIVFRLLSPKLLDLNCCGNSPPEKVLTIVKLLNRVASTNNPCIFNSEKNQLDRVIQIQNERFTNTIARALMKHKEANYCHLKKLSQIQYSQAYDLLLRELPHIETESNSKLDALMQDVMSTQLGNDLQYFLLWNSSEVIQLVELEELNLEFFKRWRLSGKDFIELSAIALQKMGMNDEEEIKATIQCIYDLQEIVIRSETTLLQTPIQSWNQKDVLVWLMLANHSDLIPTFKSHKLDGQKFSKLTVSDLDQMKIRNPNAILKILALIEK